MRRIEDCRNCGEQREIAAHNLCFACYRQHERSLARGPIDRHATPVNKQRQQLFSAYASFMVSLGKLHVCKEDIEEIVAIIRPYLVPIAEQLRFAGQRVAEPVPEEKPASVNSEQDFDPFTVHKPEDSGQ
jgi:hypothetical protein